MHFDVLIALNFTEAQLEDYSNNVLRKIYITKNTNINICRTTEKYKLLHTKKNINKHTINPVKLWWNLMAR